MHADHHPHQAYAFCDLEAAINASCTLALKSPVFTLAQRQLVAALPHDVLAGFWGCHVVILAANGGYVLFGGSSGFLVMMGDAINACLASPCMHACAA
eukprot:scaffold88405_cov16-Tisochrysis_lutea.AAC.1